MSGAVAAGSSGYASTGLTAVSSVVQSLNVGYFWMLANCITSAAYVSISSGRYHHSLISWQVLAMRKRIKATGFSDWDSMFYNNLLSIPVLIVFSIVVEDWGSENLNRNL